MSGRGSRGGGATRRGRGEDRALRAKNQDKNMAENDSDNDSEEEDLLLGVSRQTFNVHEKLESKKFGQFFVKELLGHQVNLSYFQRSGFTCPILIRQKEGLEMTIPTRDNFTITDVKNGVGARRIVDVMDCTNQKNSEMTMKDFEDYFLNPENRGTRRLNVISLEFSFTKLEPFVVAPKVVRQIDWVDNAWPRHLKDMQTEGTNDLREMHYPKVQKYCLMSVEGCYTDFHVDFGGTSVWYHIVKGAKVFWLIPPTETNLKAYEQWTLSGKQSNIFFGDLVEKCGIVKLESGNTFLIPSGWIHAVYTPADSLVFGGNFLHSFAIEKQIRVAQIEETTKVPQKFRFPFFTELQWFVLDKYVYHLLGKTHLTLDETQKQRLYGSKEDRRKFLDNMNHPHITPQEIFGIKAIIMYIHALAVSKKNVPPILPEPISLIRDVRQVIEKHKNDDPSYSITGNPLLYWPGIKNDPGYTSVGGMMALQAKLKREKNKSVDERKPPINLAPLKPQRNPCKICQACISPVPGVTARRCPQPLLDKSVLCAICGLDGWYAEPKLTLVDRGPGNNKLMECASCHEVVHPTCVTDMGVEAYERLDMPNLWECPKCVKSGKVEPLDSLAAPLAGAGGAPPPPPLQNGGPTPVKVSKTEDGSPIEAAKQPIKKIMPYGPDAAVQGFQLFSVKGAPNQPKSELRSILTEQILTASTHQHKQIPNVVRPPPVVLSAEEVYERRQKEPVDLSLELAVMLGVFKKLNTTDLSRCASVCKGWNKILQDPSLWNTVKLEGVKITSHLLSLVVQRQPKTLILDFSTVNKGQLTWLLPRIPQTRTLSLRGLDYNAAIIALNTVNCPMLDELRISYVSNMNDAALFKLLSSPKDSKPGLLSKKSRLQNLKILEVSGTEISDVGLRYIAQFLVQLSELRISNCWKITDAGLAQLSASNAAEASKTIETLTKVDMSGCKGVTFNGLTHLAKCPNLKKIDCSRCGQISPDIARKFVEDKSSRFKVSLPGPVIIAKAK